MSDVFEGSEKQFVDVFVCQKVVDEFSGPSRLDQVGVSEDPELVRDSRLAHTEGSLQLANGQFFSGQEGTEYSHPGEISDHLQEFACRLESSPDEVFYL